MDLSGIKLIVTDMDGTLLDSKGNVSDTFFKLFEELKKQDIMFVAASGRQYFSIRNKLNTIENDIHIIAENGGMTMHQGVELTSVVLGRENITTILESCKTIADCYVVLCGKKGAYIEKSSAEFMMTLAEYYNQFKVVEDLNSIVDDQFMKIAIYHKKGTEAHVYPKLQHLEGELLVKISGENWLDVSLRDANKGRALQELQEFHNISKEETMVFGDYNNDLEMMAMAKYSFAMANAHPKVKAVANYSAKSNDENGVEHILEQVLAAKAGN